MFDAFASITLMRWCALASTAALRTSPFAPLVPPKTLRIGVNRVIIIYGAFIHTTSLHFNLYRREMFNKGQQRICGTETDITLWKNNPFSTRQPMAMAGGLSFVANPVLFEWSAVRCVFIFPWRLTTFNIQRSGGVEVQRLDQVSLVYACLVGHSITSISIFLFSALQRTKDIVISWKWILLEIPLNWTKKLFNFKTFRWQWSRCKIHEAKTMRHRHKSHRKSNGVKWHPVHDGTGYCDKWR